MRSNTWQSNPGLIQGYPKLLSGYNRPAAIPHQIRETTTIWQIHSKVYAQFQKTGCVCIPELKVRIGTAIETITADKRTELDYHVDVCRITKGAHIEHL